MTTSLRVILLTISTRHTGKHADQFDHNLTIYSPPFSEITTSISDHKMKS